MPLPYGPDELALRQRVNGTVWQPGFDMPGALGPRELVNDIQRQFLDVHWPPGLWEDDVVSVGSTWTSSNATGRLQFNEATIHWSYLPSGSTNEPRRRQLVASATSARRPSPLAASTL